LKSDDSLTGAAVTDEENAPASVSVCVAGDAWGNITGEMIRSGSDNRRGRSFSKSSKKPHFVMIAMMEITLSEVFSAAC
jgi:hypothetical protein